MFLSKTVNLFEIDWNAFGGKHDPKWTRLCDSLPTRRSRWRHFQSRCKTIECYVTLNFEVASSNSFRNFSKRSFCDGEVSVGTGCVNATCRWPVVLDHIIFNGDIQIFRDNVLVLYWISAPVPAENRPFLQIWSGLNPGPAKMWPDFGFWLDLQNCANIEELQSHSQFCHIYIYWDWDTCKVISIISI